MNVRGSTHIGLVSRNVTVNGRRTSMRLEPLMWDALHEMAAREGGTVNDVISEVDRKRGDLGLTAAVRIRLLEYFRIACTEDGHARVGHGTFWRR